MAKTTTDFQLVSISKLVPYVNNARTHSPEQINKLRASLREFGFINPVIIDREFGIIAGHGRVMAAREEGIAEVPCVFVDHLTEAQKKAYKTYNSKSIQLAVNCRPGRDLQKGQRVKAYLNQTRQSANRYIRNRLKMIWIVKSLCMREGSVKKFVS